MSGLLTVATKAGIAWRLPQTLETSSYMLKSARITHGFKIRRTRLLDPFVAIS